MFFSMADHCGCTMSDSLPTERLRSTVRHSCFSPRGTSRISTTCGRVVYLYMQRVYVRAVFVYMSRQGQQSQALYHRPSLLFSTRYFFGGTSRISTICNIASHRCSRKKLYISFLRYLLKIQIYRLHVDLNLNLQLNQFTVLAPPTSCYYFCVTVRISHCELYKTINGNPINTTDYSFRFICCQYEWSLLTKWSLLYPSYLFLLIKHYMYITRGPAVQQT